MWQTIYIHDTNVELITDWSILIKFPKKSSLNGYYCYVSKKLIREGKHSASIGISFSDDFKFKVFTYIGKSRAKENEHEITAEEFRDMFSGGDIRGKKEVEGRIVLGDKIIQHHIPKPFEAVEIEPEKELLK